MSSQTHRSRSPLLGFDDLYAGHAATIETATRLFEAASAIQSDYPDIALGLFQVAEEETGKAFSLLAAFSYGHDPALWKEFWRAWRRHECKAARAFFYEWLCPTRLAFTDSTGASVFDGQTSRSTTPAEKEAAFYVDFNETTRRFITPRDSVAPEEAMNRAVSALSHSAIAAHVKAALDMGDAEWNYRTFAVIPSRILSEFTRQEDVRGLLSEFRSRSRDHSDLVDRLEASFAAVRAGYSSIIAEPGTVDRRCSLGKERGDG